MSNASSKKPVNSEKLRYGPIAAVAVSFIAYILGAQLALGIFLGLYLAVTRQNFEVSLTRLQDQPTGQLLLTAVAYAGMFLVVYAFLRWKKVSWSSIGLSRKPKLKDIGYALVSYAAYFISVAILITLISVGIPGLDLDQKQQLPFQPGEAGATLVLVFLGLVVLPPLVEEIMTRGFLYTGLRQKFKIIPAAIITSILFAVPHLQLEAEAKPVYAAAITTFVLSFYLIWLREKTGSLWSGIFLHGLNNGVAFLSLFVLGVS